MSRPPGSIPQSRRELHGEIERMKRDGHTVLLTTHNMEEAEQLCDRIAIIDHGRIIAIGAPGDLIAKSSAMQTVSLSTTPPIDAAALSGLAGIEDVSFDGARRASARPRSIAPSPTCSRASRPATST